MHSDTMEPLPGWLMGVCSEQAEFISVEDNCSSSPSLPAAWVELTVLLLHTHLSTCMTKGLASLFGQLLCELIRGSLGAVLASSAER